MNTSSSFVDPAALMAIRNLELRARTIVEGFWHGLHRSPYHGFSVEFSEYRPYSPGDDPRFLDWKLAARTDRYFIKKFEDETNLRCHLLVDVSQSMQYGSLAYSKSDYGRTLAGTLAWFLAGQGDATGLFTFDRAVRDYLPARNRPGHLRQLMLLLERPSDGTGTDLAAPLRRAAELLHKRGLVLLISDLLAPIDQLAAPLAMLTATGHEVIIFHLLDPAESRFEFNTATRFRDLESGREMEIDPGAVRDRYLQRLADHLGSIQALVQRLGIGLVSLTTDRPLELALFDFLQLRKSRPRTFRRRETP